MSVDIRIQFDNKFLTIPINPEQIESTRNADNTDMKIIGIGPATRKGSPGLKSFTIESFFPGTKSYFYTGSSPKTCIDFINKIWESDNTNNTVAKITTIGLPNEINMYFVIDEFNCTNKAGEEEDVYYSLKIKEYKPYGVRKIKKTTTSSTARANTNTAKSSSSSSKTNTYTVKKGDCLWNISKACCGNGANWKKLYNLNKKIIGSNPNLIKPRTGFNFTFWMEESKISNKIKISFKYT